MQPSLRHRMLSTAAGVVAVAVLGAVFLLYTRPTFMVTMIDQLWACF